MRAIKFRVWNKKKKLMFLPFVISEPHTQIIPTLYICKFTGEKISTVIWNDPENYILLQFTGLTDKNGKEIYEGDIVEYYHGGIKCNVNAKVFWKNTDSAFKYRTEFKDGGALICYLGKEVKRLEIIGNIWESPELLENP